MGRETISAADLFCGAGGTSLGLARACEQIGVGVDLTAINHWHRAVASHERNHPWATHRCAQIETLSPRKVIPSGRLDLIVAGCECTHHSKARGGRPMSDQSRASAWHIVHWAEELRVQNVLIENVPEFMHWGPLDEDNRPIRSRRGDTFRALITALESLDYRVEHRIINCADLGDPTTRRRFFLRARLGGGPIHWPEHTHSGEEGSELPPWKTARSIIDWNDLGTSIFSRKRPLAPRTIARIKAGIERFCGDYADSFLVMFYGTNTARSLDRPVPTVTAQGGHIGIANPFLVRYFGRSGAESVDSPLSTIAAQNKHGLITPFILPHDQFTKSNQLCLVDSVDRPMRTVSARNGDNQYLVSPFLVPHFGERPGQTPRTHSLDEPVPSVTGSKGAGSLVSPFLVPYYGQSKTNSVDDPLGTVTTKDRFALVTPDGVALDIFFRMLQPRELARAQGFPDSFEFAGNKGEVVRQIGNAVPVNTAQNLCHSILRKAA